MTGPLGPTGPQGVAGPAGPTGPQGSAGLSSVQVVNQTSAISGSSSKTATATCPSGKVVIGGGVKINNNESELAIQASYPSAPDAWTGVAREVAFELGSWSITTYAICAIAN